MKAFTLLMILGSTYLYAGSLPDYDRVEEQQESILEIEDYSRLNNVKISYYQINDPQYFMESNFHFSRVFGAKKYRIGINPLIFREGINDQALKGVMAHELMHTLDYEKYGILSVGHQYLCDNFPYERKTDLKVIYNGLGDNLIAYKEWQYKLLKPKALKKKKKQYLTPEEIQFIQEALLNVENRKKLLKYWLKDIPMSLKEFKESYDQYLTEQP